MPELETSAALTEPPRRRAAEAGAAVLVVNTRSRVGREAFETARAALTDWGVDLEEAHAVTRPQQLLRRVREAVEGGARRVLVGGGDGTIGGVAGLLAGRDVTLGVLPLGTANDFARSLGLEPTVEAACRAVAEGYVARVDVGLVNGRSFVNACSLGLASAITRRLTPELKRRAGKLAYPVAAAAELLKHRPFHVRLTTDAGVRELDVLHLVVGNGRYHGAGNVTVPDATLDDHRLNVYLVAASPAEDGAEDTGLGRLRDVAALARVGLKLRSGEHVEHPGVSCTDTRRLVLEADPPQEINADGELVGQTPATFELLPGALKVYAPAPALH